jgi:hypothetical protein
VASDHEELGTKLKSMNDAKKAFKTWCHRENPDLDERAQNNDEQKPKLQKVLPNLENLFLPETEFKNRAVSTANFNKYWADHKHGFEFIAALFSMTAGVDWQRKNSKKKRKYKNALGYFIEGDFHVLPWHSRKFQANFIGKAKYFSEFIPNRSEVPELRNRFNDVEKIRTKLNIVDIKQLLYHQNI